MNCGTAGENIDISRRTRSQSPGRLVEFAVNLDWLANVVSRAPGVLIFRAGEFPLGRGRGDADGEQGRKQTIHGAVEFDNGSWSFTVKARFGCPRRSISASCSAY